MIKGRERRMPCRERVGHKERSHSGRKVSDGCLVSPSLQADLTSTLSNQNPAESPPRSTEDSAFGLVPEAALGDCLSGHRILKLHDRQVTPSYAVNWPHPNLLPLEWTWPIGLSQAEAERPPQAVTKSPWQAHSCTGVVSSM